MHFPLRSIYFPFKILKENHFFLPFFSKQQTRSFHEEPEFIDEPEQKDVMKDVFKYRSLDDLASKNVWVVMPRQKRGPFKKTHELAQLMCDETVTLVKSIPYWSVVGSQVTSTSKIFSETIFGQTNLNDLRDCIFSNKADCVVFAIDMLKPAQHHFFRNFLNVEIYDRFSTVLKIFRERCSTKEAKLQLALAELDYVKKNLHHMKECDFQKLSLSQSFGGNFDTFYQVKKQIIQEREIQLQKSLEKISKNYEIKRKSRNTLEIPSVAVVGYTNSGKTSLIKALTHDSSLKPEDRLFATLDVTTHQLTLPFKMKALLIDTIGFITEIPATLVHCFKSTLKEICNADLIVHVIDISHPDQTLQIETVYQTLKDIDVPEKLLDTMIEVSNKVDKLVSDLDTDKLIGLPISATERIGLKELLLEIQKELIKNTNRMAFQMRVPNGGEEYQWLYKETSVIDIIPDEKDPNYVLMKIIVTKSKFGKFVKLFHKDDIKSSFQ